ncbi:MAG TPA: indole-3-glycerol phosphate synthase TrpC, partial [Candidatus Binatia bacterium]
GRENGVPWVLDLTAMTSFLDTIAGHVREEVRRRREERPPSELQSRELFHLPTRDFGASLRGSNRRIIAEIKRASPSKGLIREDFDVLGLAGALARNGAAALSVLTEERFFRGSLAYLEQIKGIVSLPLLRKDFVLDPYQLVESRSFGADAVLLITGLLEPSQLSDLIQGARALSLQALVEIHTEEELDRALTAKATLVGINSRDLRTFEVNLRGFERLVPMVPGGVTVVCESGIETPEQMQTLEALGASAFLVGETLMRARDPGARLRELLS